MKYGFVYIWLDRKHKRYYIGSHWGFENDGYICSSRWMRKAYKKRPEDFRRKILSFVYTNRSDLLEEEFYWLSKIKPEEIKNLKYYNRSIHKNGHWAAKDYESDIRKRISTTTKSAMERPEVREKFLNGIKNRDNRSSDPIIKEKRKNSMIKTMAEKFPIENRKIKLTDEQRTEYYSNKAKNMWESRSEDDKIEIGKKISNTNKGLKNRLGHKNSKDQNSKIGEANKEIFKIKRQVYKDQIIETAHLSAIKAAAVIGIGRQTVTKYRKEFL